MLLAALEADGAEPYERLVKRTGLAVDAEVVARLLQPLEDGTAPWERIVLTKKHTVVENLVDAHARLRASTLTREMLIRALRAGSSWTTAMWMLGERLPLPTRTSPNAVKQPLGPHHATLQS